jgi:acetoin utilization deacetylase AcuC-like enzyme
VPPLWLRHDASFAHDIPGHPERPDRVRALEAAMAEQDWFGCEVASAPLAARAALEAVHSARYLSYLEELCLRGGGFIDADTAAVEATWEAALRSAGGACALVEALLGGSVPCGVSALRPPGHHAEPDRAMGFCFLGNVAVAARWAQSRFGVERVLIFDWDVHHGNGTELIFATDPSVLFVSVHESPLYPGTGPASFVGAGAGEGTTVNLPVPSGTGDDAYLSLVSHVIAPLVQAFEPGLVLVSAGFDAHWRDPLATCQVTEAGFAGMTAALRRACDAVGAPLGLVLEGGYDLRALAGSMTAVMPVLTAPSVSPAPDVVPHPLAVDALRRVERWWPAVTDYSAATRRT